jgi:hypothetical protein
MQPKNIGEPLFSNRTGLDPLSVSKMWHRPYAEALLEEDGTKLPALIASAERSILTRYLEICGSAAHMDESLDLQDAMDALMQLKGIELRSAAQQKYLA